MNLYVVMIVVVILPDPLFQHKPLNMAQYAQNKVEIAKQLKLDNEVC